jgi:hypothetical protein
LIKENDDGFEGDLKVRHLVKAFAANEYLCILTFEGLYYD